MKESKRTFVITCDPINYNSLLTFVLPSTIWDERYNEVVKQRINNPEDTEYMWDVDESGELGIISPSHISAINERYKKKYT